MSKSDKPLHEQFVDHNTTAHDLGEWCAAHAAEIERALEWCARPSKLLERIAELEAERDEALRAAQNSEDGRAEMAHKLERNAELAREPETTLGRYTHPQRVMMSHDLFCRILAALKGE